MEAGKAVAFTTSTPQGGCQHKLECNRNVGKPAHQCLANGARLNGINPGLIRTERLQNRIRQLAHGQGIDVDGGAPKGL
jgi:hypothetical protein